MAKKRKTRKQKMLADLRHQTRTPSSPLTTSIHTVSIPKEAALSESDKSPIQTALPAKTITTDHYSYLVKDLKKTLILTSGIVVIQFIFAYLTKSI
jgi:hypothetical protein